ncbi:MAG: hypothetical protein LBK95_04760 [Bifidobacteriaceae bacterium]|jgi:hypothetical protein|nr:hypothetical protein [Bifidobacteriaceae bacterium]
MDVRDRDGTNPLLELSAAKTATRIVSIIAEQGGAHVCRVLPHRWAIERRRLR